MLFSSTTWESVIHFKTSLQIYETECQDLYQEQYVWARGVFSITSQESIALLICEICKRSKTTYLLFSQAEHSQFLSVSEYEQQRLQTL